MKYPLLFLIRLYQLAIGPFIGQSCRFYPTCSDYALEAIKKHGACKGSWKTVKRLCKCGPWHRGGIDQP
ncbi:MAG: membrane protein insertion efficiency factor YidD [Chlamydiales bacterium]